MKLAEVKTKNDGRIPHKISHNIVEASEQKFPSVSRHMINKAFNLLQDVINSIESF